MTPAHTRDGDDGGSRVPTPSRPQMMRGGLFFYLWNLYVYQQL